jgi:PBP1b-binding outer membrane lipoprotein LpoB
MKKEIKMKKYTLYSLMLLTLLFLSACSNSAQSNEENDVQYDKLDDVQSIKDVTIKIPEHIFNSQKKNENINEDEMKQNIKNYLDYSGELFENIVPLSLAMSDENVIESDREKLKKLIDLAKQNDANFHDFISNNTIPDDYKKPSKEIYEFISSSTALSIELDQEIEKIAQDGNLFKADFSFTKRFEKVNGRKQKEIEKFLKEKNIRTEYFNK